MADKDVTMREELLRILPPRRAKRWMGTREMMNRGARLKTRSLYGALTWMLLRGMVVRRVSETTGLFEYARNPKGAK